MTDGYLRTAALEMYAEFVAEYGHGIRNGYWPEMAAKLRRWAEMLGVEPLKPFGESSSPPGEATRAGG